MPDFETRPPPSAYEKGMKAEAKQLAVAQETPIRDEGAEMLARHIAGESRAFQELVEHYGQSIYGYLVWAGVESSVVDDLFQETFMRVHRSATLYDTKFPFRVWLFAITSNLVRSHYRKRKVRRILVGWWDRKAPPFEPPDPGENIEKKIESRERIRFLGQQLQQLPDGPRQALVLTQIEGFSLEQAAESLGVPIPTIKTWVRRGRVMLAEALAKLEEGV